MEENLLYAIISIIITAIVLILIKIFDYIKLKTLSGSYKATGVIILIICIAEGLYLTRSFGILVPAIEVIASVSALLLFFTFVTLNKLQNAISGMSIALGSRINVGTKIEFEGKNGKVIQIGLTKTIVKLDNEEKLLLIPNKKFDEEIAVVENGQGK